MTEKETSVEKAAIIMRTAWRSGKKQVTIDGILFNLTKQTHHISKEVGGQLAGRAQTRSGNVEHIEQDEHWLIAKPTSGNLVPIFSVELFNNSRVSRIVR